MNLMRHDETDVSFLVDINVDIHVFFTGSVPSAASAYVVLHPAQGELDFLDRIVYQYPCFVHPDHFPIVHIIHTHTSHQISFIYTPYEPMCVCIYIHISTIDIPSLYTFCYHIPCPSSHQAIGVTNYSLRHLEQLMKTCKIKLLGGLGVLEDWEK